MRKITSLLFVATAALCVLSPLSAQAPAPKAPKAATKAGGRLSPHETFSVVFGDRRTGNRVTITYGRPYAKERQIWGGLVKWDKADRLGADEATLLITQQPIMIGDAAIPAGAYTLYIVPSETGATKLAISSNIGKWGIPVDETKDVARVELKKGALDKHVEQLTLAIDKDEAGGGTLKISWEKTVFSVAISAKK